MKATSLESVYVLTGLVLLAFAATTLGDVEHRQRIAERIGSGLFWLILAVIFLFGGILPHWLTGLLVLVMVGLDGVGKVVRGEHPETSEEEQKEHAALLGDRIFLPVLAIPLVTCLFVIAFPFLNRDVKDGALLGLGYGGVAAMIAGLLLIGGKPRVVMAEMMAEGRRLNETMGTVNILPQLLVSIGIIFKTAGVGALIARGITWIVPADNLFLLVVASCLSMSLLTVATGNSFAALWVIATGVLDPLILKPFGVDPAMATIMTLTAGASGTLITPMAANYNIAPVDLLKIKDRNGAKDDYAVIRAQRWFAPAIWTLHVALMWLMIRARG
jgi:uncharacterized membrane protein